ncbi:MAG: hypothetical protein WCJ09_28970 [Planctomycetota bacterium]
MKSLTSLVFALMFMIGSAQAQDAAKTTKPTLILVVGANGAPQYEPMFAEWADRWLAAANQAGFHCVVVGRDKEVPDQTDKQRLLAIVDEAASDKGVELWLVMIGHGTYDRREARFNLRGPDLSAVELASWLKPVDRPMAIINCASASAPFVPLLSGPKRVVIAATKSGAEQNFARFGDYMSQAIGDASADLDKDEQTSLWEAFLRASRRTAEFYTTDGRLQTEHALLDDSGDGLGVRADQFRGLTPIEQTTDGKPLDGQSAHQWHLIRNATDAALPSDVLKKRDALEVAILQLRSKKKSMDRTAYFQELERLLVELAELNAVGTADQR